MGLTRRTLLGALAALVAAPRALFAAKPKPPVYLGHYSNVLFYESDHVPPVARPWPVGERVRHAVACWPVEHERPRFDMILEGREKLLGWAKERRLRLVSFRTKHESGEPLYIVGDFIQE